MRFVRATMKQGLCHTRLRPPERTQNVTGVGLRAAGSGGGRQRLAAVRQRTATDRAAPPPTMTIGRSSAAL
jgi:hypothetical protein